MKRIALLTAATLLGAPAAAHATTTVSNVAGTLRIDSVGNETVSNVAGTLRIDSVGNETNDLELWQAGSELRVRDDSPLTGN
jgi:hypothetical protein